MEWKNKILAYALKNAVEHEGKAKENSVLNSLFHEGLKKNKIKEIIPLIKETVKKVNSLNLKEQEEKLKNLEKEISHRTERQGLPEIPVKGKIRTRMSASPSGPLHLGHIFAILPNFLYTLKYGGDFYIRIEDTNPDNIFPPAYKMIKNEASWLTKGKAKIIIQSERIETYYKYIKKLIEKKAAYVCECESEDFKELLLKKKPCPCRELGKDKQLERWEKMLKDYEQGQAVVRFKSNLKDKNPAMRDFPLARINLTEHHLQKNKYRVWPLMNLAVAADDIEQGMTHIIRGKEHRDNGKRQKMIYKALGKEKKYPWTAYIGRLHFKDLELSASKIRTGIEEGKFKGWDDPRLPTAASLMKKYKPETFWKFTEARGISEVDKIIDKKEFFHLLNLFSKEQ
jgi:glutamyl-tRNA synthetase